jgi:uncharacterized protein
MIDLNAYLGHFAFRQLRHNTASGLLRLMDRHRIDRAAVSSAAAIAYRNAHAGNEELAAEVKGHTDRLIPFAVLNPAYSGWRDDLKQCREEFGMRGLRLYPRWHNYKLTDASCLELVNAAAANSMPVTIPLRTEDRREQSWLVDVPDVAHDEIAAVIEAAPKAHFVLMNGLGFTSSRLGRKNSGLAANYSIEICRISSVMDNELGRLIDALGEDRIVFGTGIPFHYAGPPMVSLDALDAPEAVKEKIRHGNAARLLGIA